MIYFIQEGDNGPIKIGFSSNNVEDRLATLQTASAKRLNLLWAMPGTVKKEKELHHLFEDINIRGEWFKPSKRLMKFIDSSVDNYEKFHGRCVSVKKTINFGGKKSVSVTDFKSFCYRQESEPDRKVTYDFNLDDVVKSIEKRYIREALIACRGKKTKAARLLGIKASALSSKIKRHNL